MDRGDQRDLRGATLGSASHARALTYFIQKPFQNWTRESASLIGSATLYVDYCAPIDAVRTRLAEIAKTSRLWDGAVVNLAVTELSERTMQVRCLVSAKNAGETFDLRCTRVVGSQWRLNFGTPGSGELEGHAGLEP